MIFKALKAILATAAGKGLAFIRTVVCASIFGATWQTDAFYLSVSIIGLFAGLLSSLSTAIVPIRTRQINKDGLDSANCFSSSLINLSLLLALFLSLIFYSFTPHIVHLFAPEFSGDNFNLTVAICRIFTPIIIFGNIVALLSSILNIGGKFTGPQMIGIPLNLFWLGFPFFMAKYWGIYAMVAGYLVGIIAQLTVLLPPLRGIFKYNFSFDWRHKDIKSALTMCLPIFVGSNAVVINEVVVKTLASSLAEGSISAISYALQLVGLIQGIIIIPISMIVFTRLSSLAHDTKLESFKKYFVKACTIFIIILLPITIYSIIFDKEIVQIVFQRGAFDEKANYLTRGAFFYYAIGFLPMGWNILLTRCFYALQNSRTPMIINIVVALVNILLNITLVQFMEVRGLALGTSISLFLSCLCMFTMLRKNIGMLGLMRLLQDGAKIIIAAVGLVVMAGMISHIMSNQLLLKLILAVFCSLSIYILILFFLKQNEILELFQVIKNRGYFFFR